jgi:aspartyl/asparaginyl-tRNA synthetase
MERIHISQIREKVGQQVKIAGFVHTVRDQGSIKFLIIRDITGLIQVVVTKASEEALKLAASLSMESVVEIIGVAKEEKQAPGGVEIQAEEIKI